MKVYQPIYFNVADKAVFGIVTEVLPNHTGVMAMVNPDTKQIVKVEDPHRVKNPALATKVLKAFDAVIPKPIVVVDATVESKALVAYQSALEALEHPSLTDKLYLHGMGFDVTGLPDADPNTTPINKLFF